MKAQGNLALVDSWMLVHMLTGDFVDMTELYKLF